MQWVTFLSNMNMEFKISMNQVVCKGVIPQQNFEYCSFNKNYNMFVICKVS